MTDAQLTYIIELEKKIENRNETKYTILIAK